MPPQDRMGKQAGPWIPGRQREGSPRKEKAKTSDLQRDLEALMTSLSSERAAISLRSHSRVNLELWPAALQIPPSRSVLGQSRELNPGGPHLSLLGTDQKQSHLLLQALTVRVPNSSSCISFL